MARTANGSSAPAGPAQEKTATPDPEVVARPKRRTFTAEYKLKVLRDADALAATGGVGAMLRAEGLFSSHLTEWRRERDAGQFAALEPKKRGRKARKDKALSDENARLAREVVRLNRRLAQAEAIIDVQKKVASLLGIPLKTPEDDGSDS